MKIGLLAKLAFFNVWRSRRTSLVLGMMVFAAVAALIFLSSLAVGTNDAMIQNSVGLFTGHISGEEIAFNTDPETFTIVGVQNVLFRKKQAAALRHGAFMAPVLLVGVDPLGEKNATSLWKKTILGRYPEPGEQAVYLGELTANDLKASVGDTLLCSISLVETVTVQFKICGIFRTGMAAMDRGVAFYPETVMPTPPNARSATIFLRNGVLTQPVVNELQKRIPGARFEAWTTFMPALKQLIDLNFVSMGIVMVLVFSVVSLGIACGLTIFILKNIREYGILKAMGLFPSETAFMLFSQTTLLTTAASIGGIALGVLLVVATGKTGIDLTTLTSHNPYFAVSSVIYPRLTAYSLLTPPFSALISGWIAVVWPAGSIIWERAAHILRSA